MKNYPCKTRFNLVQFKTTPEYKVSSDPKFNKDFNRLKWDRLFL